MEKPSQINDLISKHLKYLKTKLREEFLYNENRIKRGMEILKSTKDLRKTRNEMRDFVTHYWDSKEKELFKNVASYPIETCTNQIISFVHSNKDKSQFSSLKTKLLDNIKKNTEKYLDEFSKPIMEELNSKPEISDDDKEYAQDDFDMWKNRIPKIFDEDFLKFIEKDIQSLQSEASKRINLKRYSAYLTPYIDDILDILAIIQSDVISDYLERNSEVYQMVKYYAERKVRLVVNNAKKIEKVSKYIDDMRLGDNDPLIKNLITLKYDMEGLQKEFEEAEKDPSHLEAKNGMKLMHDWNLTFKKHQDFFKNAIRNY